MFAFINSIPVHFYLMKHFRGIEHQTQNSDRAVKSRRFGNNFIGIAGNVIATAAAVPAIETTTGFLLTVFASSNSLKNITGLSAATSTIHS
jgi:hypothetical protein